MTLSLRSVSLTVKIGALLVLAVAASLTLAGALIYNGMKVDVYQRVEDELVQTASAHALLFEGMKLPRLKPGEIPGRVELRRVNSVLKKILSDNPLNGQDRLDRVHLLEVDPRQRSMVVVGSLDADIPPGSVLPAPSQALQAVSRDQAQMRLLRFSFKDWMQAFAPVKAKEPPYYLLSVQFTPSIAQRRIAEKMHSILIASLLGLILTLLGALFIAHQITKPLRAFVGVMRLMQSTGNFRIKIDLHPEDREMSVVEEAFGRLTHSWLESQTKLEATTMATLKALVAALDLRDNDTAGHSLRVQRYALLIAEAMKLPTAEKMQVERGALLHDIGKIGVPDAVLHKESKLTPLEWIEMKKHPDLGRRMVENIEFLNPAKEVVYCHHERWDGKGYPQGLAGEEIPRAARVFAVADAFDTITSDRSYRQGNTFDEARREIRSCGGKQFDPAVVEAFLTLPDSAFNRVRREINKEMMGQVLGAS